MPAAGCGCTRWWCGRRPARPKTNRPRGNPTAADTRTERPMTELDAEDNKLLVLARGAMGRTGGSGGAAVRDTDGRTYAAGEVSLAALRLTALQAAVAAAISSGAEGFECAVVV